MKPFGLSLLVLGLVLGFCVQTDAFPAFQNSVQNDEVKKDPSQIGSLTKVPHTAGFYMATMNHEAVVDAVTKSNAWDAIKKSEVARGMRSAYRRGRTKGYAEYNEENPFAQYLKFYGDTFDNFIVQSGWEVARQVVGNEMFIYIDNDMAKFAEITRKAQIEAYHHLAREIDFDDPESLEISDEVGMQIAANMLKRLTDIECPTMIIGSRLEDPEGFKGMLELLESGAEAGMNELPPEADFLRDGWKVIDDKDSFFMTFNLDLSELPLDELLRDLDDAEMVAAIEEFVLNKKASLALGITDNLLLMGIASDAKKLIEFGSGDKLIDLPELAKLNESIQKNEPITGVYYISQDYAKAQFSFADGINAYMPLIEKGFVSGFFQGKDISDEERELFSKQLSESLRELGKDLKSIWPEPALQFGFAKLDPEGIRGHSFRGSEHPALDGSKPLELIQHASPETILLAVQRPRDMAKQYDIVAKWSSRLYGGLKEYALEQGIEAIEQAEKAIQSGTADLLDEVESELDSDPETEPKTKADLERQHILANEILEEFETFAGKFDRTNRLRLLPAINGQEVGLFVELVEGPKSWHPEIPETATPLPLPLPALIMGHSNQSELVSATQEHYDQVTQFYESIVAKAPEEDRPEMKWDLNLEKSENESGTLFQLTVPSDLQLDSSVRPGILISKDRIVGSFLAKQAADLSQSRNANLFGPAAENKPSSAIFFYDNRAFMKGIETWSDIAQEIAKEQANAEGVPFDLTQYEAERDTLQFTQEQLADYFQRYWNLGECWKGVSVRSYSHQGGAAGDFLFKFTDLKSSK